MRLARREGAGRFITLEGGEGTGKSTQLGLLGASLAIWGITSIRTREPGGSPGAEVLRSLLLSGGTAWSTPAETLLHFAARADHVERTIRPALAAGAWVICDRFADSTMAYQGYGQGADQSMIATLTRLIDLQPDLTIVLDVSDSIAKARQLARGGAADRYEREDAAFHARVRAGFLAIAAAEPERCVVVDAGGTPADVRDSILDVILRRLGPANADPP